MDRRALRMRLLPWVQDHFIQRYDDLYVESHTEAVEQLCDLALAQLEIEVGPLKSAIDQLWGMMPTAEALEMRETDPELVELCRNIHEELWHS